MAELQTATQDFSKQLYEAATSKPQTPPAAGPGEQGTAAGGEEVIDAEFKTKQE